MTAEVVWHPRREETRRNNDRRRQALAWEAGVQVLELEPLQFRVGIDYSMGVGAEVCQHPAEYHDDGMPQDATDPTRWMCSNICHD